MPAKRKTRADRVAEKFGELYRIGKARSGLQETEIAPLVGFRSPVPLRRRRASPLDFTLGQVMALGSAFRWTEEDWQELAGLMAGRRPS